MLYADSFKIGTCFIHEDRDCLYEVVKNEEDGKLYFTDVLKGDYFDWLDADTHYEVDKSEYYKILTCNEEQDEEDYEWESLEIFLNDESIFHVHSNIFDAEDNNLGRNFSACYNVYDLLKQFYEYGKKGVVIDFK